MENKLKFGIYAPTFSHQSQGKGNFLNDGASMVLVFYQLSENLLDEHRFAT